MKRPTEPQVTNIVYSRTPCAQSQATDEDSPPNNVLTYTIISASAFPDYFRIIMVEGYAGTQMWLSLRVCALS